MLDTPRPGADIVSEAEIEAVVRLFYGRIRQKTSGWDRSLRAPSGTIGSRICRSCSHSGPRCSSGTGRYGGRPMPKHLALKPHVVNPDDFLIWLDLFRASAHGGGRVRRRRALFIDRAERVAQSFKLTMFFDPAAIAPKRG